MDDNQQQITIPNLEPLTSLIPGGVQYIYLNHHEACPVIQLNDFHRDRSRNLFCELTAFCIQLDVMTPVGGIRFNLSSLSNRKQVARGLKEQYIDISATWIDWERILADAVLRAMKFHKDGHEVEKIWPLDEIPKPAYLIYPLLPLHQATILFGDGGAGKGHVAMTAGILAQLPFTDNRLGLVVQDIATNCLYLDYESDRGDFERVLSGLCRGFDIAVGLSRLPMSIPIADYLEQLKKRVTTDKIGFLIIDRLGPATGGNINDSEPAIRLFSALRQLDGVTTLIVAHNSKDPLSKQKSIFGSVFFTNLARSVWECKKSQEADSADMILDLKHTKFNRRQQLPLGLRYNFDDNIGSISVSRVDLKDTGLTTEIPLYLQIKNLLLSGAMTKTEIAQALNYPDKTIKAMLYKYKNIFVNIDGGRTWGVVANGASY